MSKLRKTNQTERLKKRRAKKSLQDDCRTCTQCEKRFTCKHHLDVHLRFILERNRTLAGRVSHKKEALRHI